MKNYAWHPDFTSGLSGLNRIPGRYPATSLHQVFSFLELYRCALIEAVAAMILAFSVHPDFNRPKPRRINFIDRGLFRLLSIVSLAQKETPRTSLTQRAGENGTKGPMEHCKGQGSQGPSDLLADGGKAADLTPAARNRAEAELPANTAAVDVGHTTPPNLSERNH